MYVWLLEDVSYLKKSFQRDSGQDLLYLFVVAVVKN